MHSEQSSGESKNRRQYELFRNPHSASSHIWTSSTCLYVHCLATLSSMHCDILLACLPSFICISLVPTAQCYFILPKNSFADVTRIHGFKWQAEWAVFGCTCDFAHTCHTRMYAQVNEHVQRIACSDRNASFSL